MNATEPLEPPNLVQPGTQYNYVRQLLSVHTTRISHAFKYQLAEKSPRHGPGLARRPARRSHGPAASRGHAARREAQAAARLSTRVPCTGACLERGALERALSERAPKAAAFRAVVETLPRARCSRSLKSAESPKICETSLVWISGG